MKRWQYFALALVVVAGLAYAYVNRASMGLGNIGRPAPTSDGMTTDAGDSPHRPAPVAWQLVDRTNDGFKLEMPADSKDLQVPAYNEGGGSEPVKMLFSNLEGDTTFALSWEDNPPVARVNNRSAERTLNMARDGMLSRTQTRLISETRMTPGGYPARDIAAANAGGGILNARIIFTGERLYTLMALFPSASARREQDVIRFFNSFEIERSRKIPESAPSAVHSN
jgi:hypothetical protein